MMMMMREEKGEEAEEAEEEGEGAGEGDTDSGDDNIHRGKTAKEITRHSCQMMKTFNILRPCEEKNLKIQQNSLSL